MTGELQRKEVFLWKLKEFSLLDYLSSEPYTSPVFRFCGGRWVLILYCDSYGALQVYLVGYDQISASKNLNPIEIRYSLGIGTAKLGTEVCISDCPLRLDLPFWGYWITLMHRSELLSRKHELLPQDVLTLILTMQVEVDGSHETVLENATVHATVERIVADASLQTVVEDCISCDGEGEPSEKTGPEKIVEDVGKLWPNGDHTDVLLKVKDGEFKAHRTILAARTPVLGAMFVHDTTEKASGEVIIEDCEPEIFEQLLHFIYKGSPRELTADNASALYVLADKYLVSEVKALCVRCMRDTLCLGTFCETLTLSLMHREDELLRTATDFLSRNMIDVMKSVQWQRFMREHPTWANESQIRAMELIQARYEGKKELL